MRTLLIGTGAVVWVAVLCIAAVIVWNAVQLGLLDARRKGARTRSYDRAKDAEVLASARKRADRVWSNVPPNDDEHASHLGAA